MDVPVCRGVYKEVGSFFAPYLHREGAICPVEDAGWWLQIILPIRTDKRNFCPVSCAFQVCRNGSNLTFTNQEIKILVFNQCAAKKKNRTVCSQSPALLPRHPYQSIATNQDAWVAMRIQDIEDIVEIAILHVHGESKVLVTHVTTSLSNHIIQHVLLISKPLSPNNAVQASI